MTILGIILVGVALIAFFLAYVLENGPTFVWAVILLALGIGFLG